MINEIVNQELCTGCGVCISQDKSKKSIMFKNKYGFLVPDVKDVSKENQTEMLKVCPFNPLINNGLNEDSLAKEFLVDSNNYSDKLGHYISTYVGFSNKFRETSSSGGISTYIFNELLNKNYVQSIFVVNEKNGMYEYGFINPDDDINVISKTRYIPVTLEDLFLKIDEIDGKIAVCGVGCFLKAVRLKQHYYPKYKEKIVFTVGIICGGLKSEFFSDYLSQKAGIVGTYYKQNYRIKDKESSARDYSYGAFDEEDSEFKSVRMRLVGDMWGTGMFKSKACDFCDDVTTELADISLGDAWIEPYSSQGLGNSVIITRSVFANELIKKGIDTKELSVENLDYNKFISSQRGSFTHRQDALLYRIKQLESNKMIVPYKRKRVFKNIPISSKLVQRYRSIIRRESLLKWEKYRSLEKFESALSTDKYMLRVVTKINHILRKKKK